ncbi:T9SS type A sorting domain-containing protein, partial [Desulfosarcina sp.]|nr:T9SS type A sorting domain-containing protein [Desulfosarcina sp.]
KHVAGSFYLGQCFSALYSLEGLNNLSSVLGDVKILGNGKLNIFSGLESLDSIGGDMTVEGNSSLINFEGLNNLSNINGLFSVRYNDSILNFSGFDNLISTGGLEVVSNTSLINFEGLEGLSIINGNTVIGKGGYYFSNGNPALTTLNGLDNLSYINGSLSVEYNNVLDNLTGLIALDSINGPIFITHNDTLSSLSGLDNISAGSIGYLTISQNDDLNNCAVQSICDYLTIPGAIVNINNNADGCNDTTQVNEACLGVSIEDININNKAILFPNPVIDFANLSVEFHKGNFIGIFIYNISGICMKSWQFQNNSNLRGEFELDLSDIPAGIYFCQVKIGNEMVTKKIIKTK